jgi:hypothetical protein
MIGKFSELPYHTKNPPGGMHTRANGRCCRKTTALGARIPLCGILFQWFSLLFLRNRSIVLKELADSKTKGAGNEKRETSKKGIAAYQWGIGGFFYAGYVRRLCDEKQGSKL